MCVYVCVRMTVQFVEISVCSTSAVQTMFTLETYFGSNGTRGKHRTGERPPVVYCVAVVSVKK